MNASYTQYTPHEISLRPCAVPIKATQQRKNLIFDFDIRDPASGVGTKRTCFPIAEMSDTDPKRTFPSPPLSGYTNVIPPARKTKSEMEMSKRCGGSTVSSLSCGEV
mgnify:CR=1 FL=1|jgi:hypothetical protein